VLGDGSLIKAGGRVVKNVAGYDLCKLFSGSYGTLGIITEVTFKLRPTPAVEHSLVATGEIEQLINKAAEILEARLFPVAVELISAAAADELGIKTREQGAVLLMRFAGNQRGVKFQIDQATAKLSNHQTELIQDDARLWQLLAGLPLRHSSGQSWRASVLPDQAGKIVKELSATYQSGFVESLWQLGLADGRFRMIANDQNTDEVEAIVRALGGQFFVEDPILAGKPTSALMSRVKEQLDTFKIFG
jgi:hypothetical protein